MRAQIKRALARAGSSKLADGLTVLIYHRVGGGSPDERDTTVDAFAAQVEHLRRHRVVSLDAALDELAAGDDAPKVVLTFDDGFADVHANAWPLLRKAALPFTLYVATGYVGAQMHWDGSTAKAPGPALDWEQLRELAVSPLCTIGNHTHNHVRPDRLSSDELDRCTDELEAKLHLTPRHFAYTWGIAVPAMEAQLSSRFRSAVTGELGRNHPGTDPLRLKRVPVRQSDPIEFFAAKLTGSLWPERAYAGIVAAAKKAGARA